MNIIYRQERTDMTIFNHSPLVYLENYISDVLYNLGEHLPRIGPVLVRLPVSAPANRSLYHGIHIWE